MLLDNPRNYRDPRTDGMLEEAFARVPREEIFARTGVQFLKLNTLYQLLSLRDSPLLKWAQTFLMMADLFNFYFTGTKTCEFSNATTTQFYDPRQGNLVGRAPRRAGAADSFSSPDRPARNPSRLAPTFYCC